MQGKTIVVTGAFGSLGRATATVAAARGAKVGMLDVAVPATNPVTGPNVTVPIIVVTAIVKLPKTASGIRVV